MEESVMPQLLRSLGFQLPILLAYFGGLIFAMMSMKRCRSASIVASAALATLLVTSLLASCLWAFLLQMRFDGDWERESFDWINLALSFGSSFVRAGAIAALVWAVFLGRPADEAPLDLGD